MKIEKVLAIAGGYFLLKMVADKVVSGAFSSISYSFGKPTFNFNTLLLNPSSLEVNLPLTIENKNPIGITITNFKGQLFYGNLKLSDVVIPVGGVLPANGSNTFNLKLNIVAIQLINDIVRSIQNSGAYSTLVNVIKLKGTLETSTFRVPVDTNISLA